MNLKDLFVKRGPAADNPTPDPTPPPEQPSAQDVDFVQAVLDRAAETQGDAFVAALMAERKIVPAEKDAWKQAYLEAVRADGGGQVAASATGSVLEGPMTARIRQVAGARPPHTLTQSVLESAPEGSVVLAAPSEQDKAAREMLYKAYRAQGGFGGNE